MNHGITSTASERADISSSRGPRRLEITPSRTSLVQSVPGFTPIDERGVAAGSKALTSVSGRKAPTQPTPRVLFVSSRLKSLSVLLSAVEDDVVVVQYTYDSASLELLQAEV